MVGRPGAEQDVEFVLGAAGVAGGVDVGQVGLELGRGRGFVGAGRLVGDVQPFADAGEEAVEFGAAVAGIFCDAGGQREAKGHGAAERDGNLFVAEDAPEGSFDPGGGLLRLEEVAVAHGTERQPARESEGAVVGDGGTGREPGGRCRELAGKGEPGRFDGARGRRERDPVGSSADEDGVGLLALDSAFDDVRVCVIRPGGFPDRFNWLLEHLGHTFLDDVPGTLLHANRAEVVVGVPMRRIFTRRW